MANPLLKAWAPRNFTPASLNRRSSIMRSPLRAKFLLAEPNHSQSDFAGRFRR